MTASWPDSTPRRPATSYKHSKDIMEKLNSRFYRVVQFNTEIVGFQKFEAYPPGSGTFEFRICSYVASESNIRNQVRCNKVVDSTGIRIKRWIQLYPKCRIYDTCKCCCTEIQQWPWESFNHTLNSPACI